MTDKLNIEEQAVLAIRNSVRWLFELLRNIAVVGAIMYLGRKTDNLFLIILAQIGVFLLAQFVLGYLGDAFLMMVDPPPASRLSQKFKVAIFILATVLVFVGFQFLLNKAVNDIANAYLLAPK